MKFDVFQSKSSSNTLRMPHQQEAVNRLNEYFNVDNPEEPQSGLLVMPTGSRVIIMTRAVFIVVAGFSEVFSKKLRAV